MTPLPHFFLPLPFFASFASRPPQLSQLFSPFRLQNSHTRLFLPHLSFNGRLSSLSEADASFVKGVSHSFRRLLQPALYFMLRHVGRLLLSICFNYPLIARCPFLNACLLFLSGWCEKFAVDCDFLHYLNWWLISLLGFQLCRHERQKKTDVRNVCESFFISLVGLSSFSPDR